MALSEKHIDEIVELYDSGAGDSIGDIAKSYPNATPAMIKFHLRARGVLVADGRTKAAKTARTPVSETNDLIGDDDEALGIGESEAEVDMDALMANPKLAALIEAAVAKRLQASGAAPSASGSEAAFNAFLSKFDHMLEVQAEQRPGYIKPLSADEVDGRAKGRKDMFALLRKLKADNLWPHYLLSDEGNPFYGPSPNGPMLYSAGQEIKTLLPPSECFRPLNDPAVQVIEAYRRWIGDVIPIGDLIAQAAADARGQPIAVEVSQEMKTLEPEVMLVDAPMRDVAPKRVLGTITPETRGKPMPLQPGVSQQPAGPIFVAEGA